MARRGERPALSLGAALLWCAAGGGAGALTGALALVPAALALWAGWLQGGGEETIVLICAVLGGVAAGVCAAWKPGPRVLLRSLGGGLAMAALLALAGWCLGWGPALTLGTLARAGACLGGAAAAGVVRSLVK